MVRAPGSIRDAILAHLKSNSEGASTSEIQAAVEMQIGKVSPSSVRSYLNLNVPEVFERIGRGKYRLAKNSLRTSKGG